MGPPGSGKTHALAEGVAELIHRLPTARVLVVGPAGLTAQLVSMLADRIGDVTRLTLVTGRSFLALQADTVNDDWGPGVFVVSLELLSKRDDLSRRLIASTWDLVAVDEAHHLRGARGSVVRALAVGGRVRSVVLLSAIDPKDASVTNYAEVIRWTRPDRPAGHRSRIIITYARTEEELELYLRLHKFLETQLDDPLLRDGIERAWRSSVSALERVLVRARSRLEIIHATAGRRSQLSLFDPLVMGDELAMEAGDDEKAGWRDPAIAGAELDALLQCISSLAVDSKLEAALMELAHRPGDRTSAPCVITAMRETALYVAEALESRQEPVNLIEGGRHLHSGGSAGTRRRYGRHRLCDPRTAADDKHDPELRPTAIASSR